MNKSTALLTQLLATLSARARARGLTDAAWAKAAGVRNETLSRLRSRDSCDLATLHALADVVAARLVIAADSDIPYAAGEHFPSRFTREEEELLLKLAVSGDLSADTWRARGPTFFMAGVAVMLASVNGFDRQRLLALAEQLHPGSSQPEVFTLWLARSPLRPSRFLPLLTQQDAA
jgi:hypothetical protein